VVTYVIFPKTEGLTIPLNVPPDDLNRLTALSRRIETMARRELGEDFLSLTPIDIGLSLAVSPWTSTRKGQALRDLFGWITLFDSEG
jgi:hypothetical protein